LKNIFIQSADLFFLQELTLCLLVLFTGGTEPPLLRENEMDYLAVLVRQKPTVCVGNEQKKQENEKKIFGNPPKIFFSIVTKPNHKVNCSC
jgi:hypothetical protein